MSDAEGAQGAGDGVVVDFVGVLIRVAVAAAAAAADAVGGMVSSHKRDCRSISCNQDRTVLRFNYTEGEVGEEGGAIEGCA